MVRVIGKLPGGAHAKAKPGLHADGGGLYLQIGPEGTKSWIFRFMLNGRARAMGLGPLHAVSLADARKKATNCRGLLVDGTDPIEARDKGRTERKLEAAKAMTFKGCAEAYIKSHKDGWKNPKHAAQWTATLSTYAYPVFGEVSVQSVDTGLVLRVLEPMWKEKTETASRVRGRIEQVLDWATVRGLRAGDNPARWRGFLDHMLPKRSSVQKVQHHPALPYNQIASFMVSLGEQEGTGARALELLILTATRTGELIGARWDEIDLGEKVWTIPAERMKAGREHRVPLSELAVSLVRRIAESRSGDFVFPGSNPKKPISNMTLLAVLKRMKRTELTVHGFRSTFRDWAAEQTNFPREVAEAALAHTIGDKVEAAYRRGDLFEKRRGLMGEWAQYCKETAIFETVTATDRSDVVAERRRTG